MNEQSSFEEALEVLEDSVSRLESGDLNLEGALEVFEQGVAASRACTKALDQARKRVQVLVADEQGEFQLSFLDEGDEEGEEED